MACAILLGSMTNTFNFDVIGLETRDRRVYEALVASPQSSLRKIAADTGINRGSVYESVKKLAEHGLVGSIEVGKQRRYTATEPKAIRELIRERKDALTQAEKMADTYIETLRQKTENGSNETPFATFYEDHEGVAAILRDVLATCRGGRNGSAYRVISTRQVSGYMYQNFPNFTQRRIAEGISVRVIGVENSQALTRDQLSERRVLPLKRGEATNCYTLIYGNKTAFVTINDQNILSAIVVDNPGVTHLQKEIFDHLWKSLT